MPQHNWNKAGTLPDSSPELNAIIQGCTKTQEMREKVLQHWASEGVSVRDSTG